MTHTTDRTIGQHVSFSLEPNDQGSVRSEIRFCLHPDVTHLRIDLPAALTPARLEGFVDADGRRFEWDGRTETPRLRARYDANNAAVGGYKTIDRGDWAIVSRPPQGIQSNWRYTGAALDFGRTYHVDGSGVVSPDGAIAYLGPYAEHERRSGTQQLRLVVPGAASLQARPAEILECVAEAGTVLDAGPRDEEVLMIAAPSVADWGPAGTQFGDAGFWALDRTALDHPNNTWIHEYVHTLQAFDHAESLQWFVEGTASYYAAWCGVQQGRITFDRFRSYLACDRYADAVLAAPDTWPAVQVQYTKARLVTAALDAELRRRTDGSVGATTLLRCLNEQEQAGACGLDALVSCARRAGADGIESWLDCYVETADAPSLPESPGAFGLASDSGHDGGERPPPSDQRDGDPKRDDLPDGDGGGDRSDSDGSTGRRDPDVDGPDRETDDREQGSDEEQPPVEESDEPTGECPVCGAAVPPDSDFCATCGTSLTRECHVCGAQASGQRYCPICGTELDASCEVCGRRQSASHTYCEDCGTEL